MAQSSDLDLNSIQVVEIPVQIKEEKLFLDGHRIEPEVHKDPGKFSDLCCTFRFRSIIISFVLKRKEQKND